MPLSNKKGQKRPIIEQDSDNSQEFSENEGNEDSIDELINSSPLKKKKKDQSP
jgi:hypothetical protein